MTETTTPPAPPGDAAPRRRRRRVLPRVFIVAAVVLVLAIAAAAIYAVTIDRSVTQNITRGIDLPGDEPICRARPHGRRRNRWRPAPSTTCCSAPTAATPNNEGNGRSDSIMVVHLNAERNKAYIISFPRDMYVDIPGYGKNKINAAFSFGGAALDRADPGGPHRACGWTTSCWSTSRASSSSPTTSAA